MKNIIFGIAIWLLATASATAAESASKPTIRDLDRLIGIWEFEDAATENAGYEYVETGTRICAYALDDKYIRCESKGKAKDKERTYVFYFNYNDADERFEMLSMFGNYSRKILYHLTVSEDGRRIDLTTGPNPEEDEIERSWATISFQSDDQFTWESRLNKGGDLPDHWPVTFRETARRKN